MNAHAITEALAHHQAGRLAEAEALYRQILAVQPQHPDALHLLGVLAHQVGQQDAAVELIRQAIAVKPEEAAFHANLGDAYFSLGRSAEAIACYRKAMTIQPNYPKALNNMGNALLSQGRLEDAVKAYEQALVLQPHYPKALNNMGNALTSQGRLSDAVFAYEQAIAIEPDNSEALNNMGNALYGQGRIEDAVAAFERTLALKPAFAEAHNNMGIALAYQGRLDEAAAAYERALSARPDYPNAYNNRGHVLSAQGRLEKAVANFRQACRLAPDSPDFHSSLVFALHFHPDYDAKALSEEHQQWQRRHEQPRRSLPQSHTNTPDPERRLKIGYVSPDLWEHPVGRFLMPLMEYHDHTDFEITCYADLTKPDAVTERLRACADQWRETFGYSENRLAEQIRQDGIDILVDLALHTGGNRLPVFAHKPAPVQVTYLAYPSTSGLKAIGYRLTDRYLDPPNTYDLYYSESSVYLPQTYWCYAAPAEAPDVALLPAQDAGRITFGCFHNFSKVNECVLTLWARLLCAVPDSRLILHAREGSHREDTRNTLARAGISADRLSFADAVPLPEYYSHYRRIDIALDTFPYAGGTTTCDALWMGVPVVSLVGQTAVGRGGLSILSNIGLPELAAQTEDEYVKIAADLAHDLPRLAHLRATMRERMLASPLMDAPRFARNIEDAYRTLWGKWCEEQEKKADQEKSEVSRQ